MKYENMKTTILFAAIVIFMLSVINYVSQSSNTCINSVAERSSFKIKGSVSPEYALFLIPIVFSQIYPVDLQNIHLTSSLRNKCVLT